MGTIEHIAAFSEQLTAWRRELHAYPETAFEEHRTSDFVAGKLREFGIETRRGLAVTGVVGTLKNGDGPAIGLRADMDALNMDEANDCAHKSVIPGKMHACGHDGHMTMLLGAARYLAETRRFNGTVHFIFQPAEELAGGAKRMIDEGLFREFPVDSVYAMHNLTGLAVGTAAIKAGPMMGASDTFEIVMQGNATHAALPHLGDDTIVAASALVGTLQTIVSRIANPIEPAVVSFTQIHGGHAWNVLPEQVVLRGTVRTLSEGMRKKIEEALRHQVEHIARAHNISGKVEYWRGYPTLVNHAAQTAIAADVARQVVGPDQVDDAFDPVMGSEDFAYMLEQHPGALLWLGAGPAAPGAGLHGTRYDFNDDILPIGASYWARLVENQLLA